jgi:hypothetical protein
VGRSAPKTVRIKVRKLMAAGLISMIRLTGRGYFGNDVRDECDKPLAQRTGTD